MALDMYLFKLTKPELDTTKVYTESELKDISYATVEDVNTDKLIPQKMLDNFTVKIKIAIKYWDKEKLYKTFQQAHPTIYKGLYTKDKVFTPENVGFEEKNGYIFTLVDTARDDGPGIEISIKNEAQLEHYSTSKEAEFYAWKTEELAHQEEGLTTKVNLPENSSYTFDKAIVEKLHADGVSAEFLEKWIDGQTVFHPWW